MGCLFCELQGDKDNLVYEDAVVYAVVDRFPFSNRHLLVIPKEHHDVMHKYGDDTLAHVARVAAHVVRTLGMESYNLLQNNVNGQLVGHSHLHVIGANESGRLSLGSSTALRLSDAEYRELVGEIRGLMGPANTLDAGRY